MATRSFQVSAVVETDRQFVVTYDNEQETFIFAPGLVICQRVTVTSGPYSRITFHGADNVELVVSPEQAVKINDRSWLIGTLSGK